MIDFPISEANEETQQRSTNPLALVGSVWQKKKKKKKMPGPCDDPRITCFRWSTMTPDKDIWKSFVKVPAAE